ncbi:hypothetical protein [Streptomyces sp. NPDC001123]
MSLFASDEELLFTSGTVQAAQEASKKLLLNAIGVWAARGHTYISINIPIGPETCAA